MDIQWELENAIGDDGPDLPRPIAAPGYPGRAPVGQDQRGTVQSHAHRA